MPLVITMLIFSVAFASEGYCALAKRDLESRALRRNERCEHPRCGRTDAYLDQME